ncbi:AI-2E family transporter [Aeromicrobium sp. UC242_57]|uniref:AI-2E family transporter n=1 Tax=Aeromicrobium sp. UC242_57 TaxID=3374624 RepID=UPI0037A299EC
MNSKHQIPVGVEIATQWAWRLLVIAAAGALGIWLLRYFSEITVPVAVALLGTALTVDVVNWLQARGLPRILATFTVVIVMLAAFFGMLALVGQQALHAGN